LKKLLGQIKELAKFTVAGWLAILTDFGVYNGLLLLLPHWASKGISFTCGGAVAYLVNKYWTFRQRRKSYVEIVKFVVINGSGLGMNVGINELVLRWSGGNTILAFAAAVALSGSYIYLGQKFWVFRKKKKDGTEENQEDSQHAAHG
jgi:putative flippase GtrA